MKKDTEAQLYFLQKLTKTFLKNGWEINLSFKRHSKKSLGASQPEYLQLYNIYSRRQNWKS